ncbi:hypothetical protein [Dictyobacter arantiisoli]|uniref:Uncharacterized protein n=1 Tax=Dictyobacter arantiisoli TaxID=2014874 RepID=A0A5A5T803_9CHLR|nr:hypothetical protein [Dictyobacter arantiisoli]GCF07395.1 hypothetical protein KDI_09590 [Dictyobacter arantiisoli]
MRISQRDWLLTPITRQKAALFSVVGISMVALLLLTLHYCMAPALLPRSSNNANNLTIAVDAGFDNTYRSGYWTPVHVTINNSGPAFQGTLAVQTFSGGSMAQHIDALSPWSFNQSIALAQGTQKQYTLYAPRYSGNLLTRGFLATISDENGKTINQQVSRQGYEVQAGDTLVGILSDDTALSAQLTKITLINQSTSVNVTHLDARTMPTLEAVLENFDVIVLDNFATNTLNIQQLETLQTWVNRGGILLEVGGLSWQRTFTGLPSTLLPVTMQGLSLLPAQTHLLSFNGDFSATSTSDIPPLQPTISTATIHQQSAFSNSKTIVSENNIPLIVQGHQGAGSIVYLAFDPAALPLDTWSVSPSLWQALLQRTLSDRLLIASGAQNYDGGPGQILTRGGIVNFLLPDMSSGTFQLFLLLIGYLLCLGPIRLWMVRKHHQARFWHWRVILSSILIFSLLSYGVAYYQKNRAVNSNSVSLIQINQNGNAAHITTYLGILSPNQGNVQLQIPGTNLTEPIDGQYLTSNTTLPAQSMNSIAARITYTNKTTDVVMNNSHLWSMDPMFSEQDLQLQGNLTGHLTLRDNHVLGVIHNNLHTTLSDTYVLFPHTAIPLGHFAINQTRSFDIQLKSTIPALEQTLAEQIARQTGLPGQYFPYQQKKQPATPLQQHVALLSALSGVGYNYAACEGSCLTHAIANKGNIYVTGGQIPDPNMKNDYDPLLIPGAQATLIGWADSPLNGQQEPTINNLTPHGQHINFLQMPLSMDFTGLMTIPQDVVVGNIIGINSYDAGAILPGAYTLSTGNVRFELPLPATSHISIRSITITIPNLITHPAGPGSSTTARGGNIRAKIYNWQSQKWEGMPLASDDTFTTQQPETYTGLYGRILMQISSKTSTAIYFGKPLLSISGNALP